MQKNLIYVLSIVLFWISGCSENNEGVRTPEMEMKELEVHIEKLKADGKEVFKTPLSVYYTVIKEGDGVTPNIGDSVSISYVGFLPNGEKIEDSNEIYNNGIWKFPFRIKPEVHEVIGMLDGVAFMSKGAVHEMYIPSDQQLYGAKGTSVVPPYTTLTYRVTLNDITPPEKNEYKREE